MHQKIALAYLHDKRLFWYRVDVRPGSFQFAQTSNKLCGYGIQLVMKIIIVSLGIFLEDTIRLNLQALFMGQTRVSRPDASRLWLWFYGEFGENAMVDLTTFSVDGKHGKKFRKPT